MKKLYRCLRCFLSKRAEEFSQYKGSPILGCLECERPLVKTEGKVSKEQRERFWVAVERVVEAYRTSKG